MNFVSSQFTIFFLACITCFYASPAKWRMPVLLIFSYVFYATWSAPFIIIILITTTFDFWMAKLIANNTAYRSRQLMYLWAGIILNLCVLGIFKYANFFISTTISTRDLFFHTKTTFVPFDIILPLGISFYTFEAISYLVDVYRGNAPAKTFLEYNFYIMYFPHLISGPIIRFGKFTRQIAGPISLPNVQRIKSGILLTTLGFAFKVLVADPLATIADPIFATPAHNNPLMVWIAALAFTGQIYFDFMGYTHIARGVSLMFNLELPLNFNHPYSSNNISDFWRNWHMSLSSWIRDYLYFPLGGGHVPTLQKTINLIFVMTIVGFWHGAGFPFIIWGFYNGVLLAILHAWRGLKRINPKLTLSLAKFSIFSTPITYVSVVVGWVFFRSVDLETALTILRKMSNTTEAWKILTQEIMSANYTSLICLSMILILCFIGPTAESCYRKYMEPMPDWFKSAAIGTFAIIAFVLSANSTRPFIYFQF